MNWGETTTSLGSLRDDLRQCWEYLKVISKPETFPLCEKRLSSAAERLGVMEVVHRRISNQLNRLYLYMGMDVAVARGQKVWHNNCCKIHNCTWKLPCQCSFPLRFPVRLLVYSGPSSLTITNTEHLKY